jgi:acyl-CoA synthetase (NDP forming)
MIASATPEHFRRAIEMVLGSGEVDGLIVIYVSPGTPDTEAIARAIGEGMAGIRRSGVTDKPILTCLMPEPEGRILKASEDIPTCPSPERVARVLGKMAASAEWRSKPLGEVAHFKDAEIPVVRSCCRRALMERGAGWLSSGETRLVLQSMHLPLAPGGLVRTAQAAVSMAQRLAYPVVVKLASQRLVHKTEVGGVCLNLQNDAAVRQAFDEIRKRLAKSGQLDAMEGVLVQPMYPGGVEVMVGMSRDPLFGPLVAFGLGGIHVEVLGDVCFRMTPLTNRDACAMVRGIRGFRLLEGYRGRPPADLAAIGEILLRISQLVEEIPEISEIDLNPIIALEPGQGCRIVDARIRVEPIRQLPEVGGKTGVL